MKFQNVIKLDVMEIGTKNQADLLNHTYGYEKGDQNAIIFPTVEQLNTFDENYEVYIERDGNVSVIEK